MSTRTDYTADEWGAISAAPAAANLVFTLFAVPGSRAANRMKVVRRRIPRSEPDHVPDIVRIIAEHMKNATNGTELPHTAEWTPDRVRNDLIDTVRHAVRVIEVRSPGEVEAFKGWLALIAARACHASNSGAGGTMAELDKQETLERLAEILAVGPSNDQFAITAPVADPSYATARMRE
jgi:hypothetical protein